MLDNRDSQPENYTAFDTKEIEFDEFENVNNRIEKFKSVCFSSEKGSKDSFYNAILYAIDFKLGETQNFVTDGNDIEKIVGKENFDSLKKIASKFVVNNI